MITSKFFCVEIIKNILNYKNDYPLIVGNDQRLVSLWSRKTFLPFLKTWSCIKPVHNIIHIIKIMANTNLLSLTPQHGLGDRSTYPQWQSSKLVSINSFFPLDVYNILAKFSRIESEQSFWLTWASFHKMTFSSSLSPLPSPTLQIVLLKP